MTMTPKQKAEKLWWDYYSAIEHTLSEEYSPHESAIAKQCALIAISFAKSSLDWHLYPLDKEWIELNQIKEEIQNL